MLMSFNAIFIIYLNWKSMLTWTLYHVTMLFSLLMHLSNI